MIINNRNTSTVSICPLHINKNTLAQFAAMSTNTFQNFRRKIFLHQPDTVATKFAYFSTAYNWAWLATPIEYLTEK